MKSSLLVPLLFSLIQLLSLPSGPDQRLPIKANSENCEEIRADNADDCLRINHIQLLGTHNSYHVKPPARLVSLLDEYEKGWAENIDTPTGRCRNSLRNVESDSSSSIFFRIRKADIMRSHREPFSQRTPTILAIPN